MTTSIIFLDIDGVMIPARSYLRPDADGEGHAYFIENTDFDAVAANIVRRLCERFDPCKVVFNTSWNQNPERLRGKVVKAGLLEHTYIGTEGVDSRTNFPILPNRLIAIEDWINRYPQVVGDEPNWVAFDDQQMMDSRAIPIDPLDGILYMDYNRATTILGNHDSRVVMV